VKSEMKIKAIAPWFGGKRNLAPRIVELLGKHRVYWEPFCGSMAVLMAKLPCVMETVNDLHADLINLAFHQWQKKLKIGARSWPVCGSSRTVPALSRVTRHGKDLPE